jgi:hypothetical protein
MVKNDPEQNKKESKLINNQAKTWGVDYNDLSDYIHALKEDSGLGGADNVSFGRNGEIYSPSGEELGNVNDVKRE